MHPPEVESVAAWQDDEHTGVIFANELLDNLPFRLAVYDGEWREACVATAADGSFVEVLAELGADRPDSLPATARHGARVPVQDAANAWVTTARSALREGCVIVIDYASTTAQLAERPFREWLRTYRRHGRGEHYLRAPGTQDITSEVALDQLPDGASVTTQVEWLRTWGIGELVEEGKRLWRERAATPDVAAVRMRSRVGEAEALLDTAGLGAFAVLVWEVTADRSSSAGNGR
jgi:SAM-dependent MidA family methyltransferase